MQHHRAGSGWSTHSIPTTAATSSNPRSASGSSTASTSYSDVSPTVTGSARDSARSTTTASFRKSSSPLMRNDAPSFVAPSWSRPSPIQQQQQQQQQQIPHRPRHYQHSSQSSESNGTWSPLRTTPSANSSPLVTASHLPASVANPASIFSAPPNQIGLTTRGHQAYSRETIPSASLPTSLAATNGSAPVVTSAVAVPAPTRAFPSAFGVTQRVALTTSRPQTLPRAKSTSGSVRTASIVDENAWRRPEAPHGSSVPPLPRHVSSSSSSSSSSSLQRDESDRSSVKAWLGATEQSTSPFVSPTMNASTSSLIEADSATTVTSSASTATLEIERAHRTPARQRRKSSSSTDRDRDRTVSAPPSVVDRPRQRAPDPNVSGTLTLTAAEMRAQRLASSNASSSNRPFASTTENDDWASGLDTPITPIRPTAPMSYHAVRSASTTSLSSSRTLDSSFATTPSPAKSSRHRKASGSVSSIGSFASASRMLARMSFGGTPPRKSNKGRASFESDHRSSPGASSDSGYRYSGESSASDRPSYLGKGPAPTLSLDLDLGGSDTMFDIASLLKATQEGVFGVGSEKERSEEKERVGPPTPRNLQPSFDHRLPVTPRATLAPESQSQITPKATESILEANSPEVEDMTTPTSQPQAPFRPLTNESSPSTSPLASKTTSYINRKEPPKVDLKLEMELEMERAMASSTEIVPGSTDSKSFASASVPTLPLLSPLSPARSPRSVILPHQEPVNFGEASLAVAPSPPQTKRRRSFGSILNRSPSKDRLNTISGPINPSRSTTPEPSMSTSTSANSLSGPSTSTNGQPPALGPIALKGIQDSAVDKSLPPTPTVSQSSNSPRPQLDDEPLAAGKGDAASGPGRSFLPKGKSSTTASVFQVVSATTSKRRPSFSSNTMLENDPPYLYPTGPPPPIPSGSRSTSSSTLGKRIVGVLGGGTKPNLSSHERKASQFDVSTFPGEENSLDPSSTIPSAPVVRRKSFSNLLGGIGDKKPAQALLGMSLSAARKSEELLGRLNPGAKKKAHSGEVGGAEPGASRTSFDVLNRPAEGNRRPSMDALSNGLTIQAPPILHNKQSYSSTMSSDSLPSISNGSSSSLSETGHVERAQLVHPTLSSRMPSRSMESVSATRATAHLIGASSTMLAPTRSASPTSSGYRTASPTPARPPDASAESTLSERASSSASLVKGESLQSSSTSHPIKWRKRVRGVAPVAGAESTFSKTWLKMEDALATYKAAVRENRGDRGPLVSGTILAFLRTQEDAPSPRVTPSLATQQRQVLFGWLDVLTTELREMQPTHRGICLEAVAAILECHFTSTLELQDDEASQAQYRSAVVKVLSFAIEKLNDKAVYANTLVFSGRILALSFFRIEGVALKLLKALPPIKKAYLRRILEEVGIDEYNLPAIDLDVFPPHLWDLCLRDMRSYTNLLLPTVAKPTTEDASVLVSDGEVVIDMSGNWLIRWTASDSDLPFAFYRAYHRQLAAQLVPIEAREEFNSLPPVDPSAVITAPGCLFLAASILEKTDALIHRNLRSVTSITPNNSNFNTNDSANLSFGQKPKILELANRRVVATLLDIVGGSPAPPGDTTLTLANSDAETRRRVFGKMLQLWIRACVKKTSLWDTRSVFILLDLLEGMIYTLSYPPPSASKNMDDEHIVPRPAESCLEMFDIPFIFSFIRIILAEADNTVTVMRTIAFIYAHFEIFTLRPSDRKELCENIILDKVLFPRLYLHWNAGVRGYFIRLLVWRLARLGVVDAEQHPDAPRDPAILALFGLMNVRLEAIRRRHDELEPLDTLTDDDMFKPKRSTICSTRGVKEAPFTVDELVGPLPEDSETSDSDDDEVKQEMVRSSPALTSSSSSFPRLPGDGSSTPPSSANGSGGKKSVPSVARVVSWLKGGLGKKQHASGKQSSISSMEELRSNSRINPFILDSVASAKNKLRNPRQPNSTGSSASSVRSLSSVDSADSAARSSPEQSDAAWATVPSTPEFGEATDTPMPLDPRPSSPAFFAFGFEGAAVAPAAAETPPIVGDSMPRSGGAPSISGLSIVSGDTVFPQQPRRRSMLLHGAAGANGNGGANGLVSPRVSLRFSKRISILPPAALELFRESGAPVPAIPERFRAEVYDRTLHQYAVRSLREYEDALDEWTDWVARLQQEEDEGKKFNKGFVDAVPRLAVSWPSSFEAEE